MNATVKAKPTKNFSSKRKLPYHKIRRSACFPPHLPFCLKHSRLIPVFHILFSFTPVESPPFDTSPGDIKEATLTDAAMCLTKGHRGCNGRQVNVPP